MNGVLIYTSSGDSEGSMGGVVASGKRIILKELLSQHWKGHNGVHMIQSVWIQRGKEQTLVISLHVILVFYFLKHHVKK